MSSEERFWASRLRWRLRGAMQWPAFVVFTLADAFVLDALPPVATTGLNLIEGALMATFGNLFLVGVLAPFLTRRLAARNSAVPAPVPVGGTVPPPEVGREVLGDRVATALLAAGLAACLASGLANRPVIVSETEATEDNARAVQEYVSHSGDEELKRNLQTANTFKLGEEFFRTCIARDDRTKRVCLLVRTNREPPQVRRDPGSQPNPTVESAR